MRISWEWLKLKKWERFSDHLEVCSLNVFAFYWVLLHLFKVPSDFNFFILQYHIFIFIKVLFFFLGWGRKWERERWEDYSDASRYREKICWRIAGGNKATCSREVGKKKEVIYWENHWAIIHWRWVRKWQLLWLLIYQEAWKRSIAYIQSGFNFRWYSGHEEKLINCGQTERWLGQCCHSRIRV